MLWIASSFANWSNWSDRIVRMYSLNKIHFNNGCYVAYQLKLKFGEHKYLGSIPVDGNWFYRIFMVNYKSVPMPCVIWIELGNEFEGKVIINNDCYCGGVAMVLQPWARDEDWPVMRSVWLPSIWHQPNCTFAKWAIRTASLKPSPRSISSVRTRLVVFRCLFLPPRLLSLRWGVLHPDSSPLKGNA